MDTITSLKEEKPKLYEKFGLREVKDTVYRLQKEGINLEGNYYDD
jgi:hypothetical protein